MYGVYSCNLNHLNSDIKTVLTNLCSYSKKLNNMALYLYRQHIFNNGYKLFNKADAYKLLKDEYWYKMIQSNCSQKIIDKVNDSVKSFLKLRVHPDFKDTAKLPRYIKKTEYNSIYINQIWRNNNKVSLPISKLYTKTFGKTKIYFDIPKDIQDKKICYIQIKPIDNCKFFKIYFIYEQTDLNSVTNNNNNVVSIDLGVNNFLTCVTNQSKAFIISGLPIKTINQYVNKEDARLKQLYRSLGFDEKFYSNKLRKLWSKRNNRINDYISKSAKLIINYCLNNNISNIVLGYNKDIQKDINIGKANNQNFVNIPIGLFKSKLEYLTAYYNINLVIQEESYTSKASFFDNDDIPVKNDDLNTALIKFSGKRIKRGLYKTAKGLFINADINASLNIMKKAGFINNALEISLNHSLTNPVKVNAFKSNGIAS